MKLSAELKAALQGTMDCYLWLSDNPTASKVDYFQKMFPGERVPMHWCHCCQYVFDHNGGRRPVCSKLEVDNPHSVADHDLCPLKDLWPHGCMADDSPYYRWSRRWLPTKTQPAALTIANRCRQVMEGYL